MNYDRQQAIAVLKQYLSNGRYDHSLGVEEYAQRLAQIHSEDKLKCSAAGLLHDMARGLESVEMLVLSREYGYKIDDIYMKYPKLLHGPASAELAKQKLGITEPVVLEAISNHTIPTEDMANIEKIVFIADKLEMNRSYPGVKELRILSERNLDECYYEIIKNTISYLLSKSMIVHPGTILAYNKHVEANKTLLIDK